MPCGSQKIFPKLHPRKTNSWKSLKIHVPFFFAARDASSKSSVFIYFEGVEPLVFGRGCIQSPLRQVIWRKPHLPAGMPKGWAQTYPSESEDPEAKCFFKRPMVDDVVDDDIFSYFLFKSCEFCVFSFCSMSRDLCVFLLVAAEAAAKLSLKLAELFFFCNLDTIHL